MELRPLGQTGIRVSPIGLGTIKLGRDRGVKYPTPVRIPTDDQASELLKRARTLGVNLIDTAPAYGSSEQRLGQLLAGQRDQWVVCTKVGESFDDGVSSYDFTPEGVAASVDRSLARLRTDRVDVLLAHSDGTIEHELISSGLLDAMRRAKDAGKARAIGISTKSCEGAMLAVEHCAVVMLTLNEAYDADLPAIEAARARGVGVLVKKALASGHLALGGSVLRTDSLGRSVLRTDLTSNPNNDDEKSQPQEVGSESRPTRAIRFATNTPGVSSVILGTTNPGHLAAACKAV